MKQLSTENIDWDSIGGDASIQSLGFDSLTLLDLAYDIQQEFNADFEAEELVGVDTVGALADLLESKAS
jgi:acyl carrier protein